MIDHPELESEEAWRTNGFMRSRADWVRRVAATMLVLSLTAPFLIPTGLWGQEQPQVAPSAGLFPPDSTVLAILKERVGHGLAAGMVVGMLEADGTTRFVAWGDPGPGQPPLDRETVFEIGSITKVFTGTLLANMALNGEVALDDPVQRYLPPGVTMPERNGKEITLELLSEQRSGLPRLPDNLAPPDLSNPYAHYTPQDLYDFLSGYRLRRDPGRTFEYSNLGVGLLGHVLALRADTSYEALVRERILDPLNMDHTGITLTPWMREHLALGLTASGEVVPNWDIPTLAGAGALRSNAEDMLIFLAANLNLEEEPLGVAMAMAQAERGPADAPGRTVGLNWLRQPLGNDTMIWHKGGTGGYRTFMGIVPARGLGVVVLANSPNAASDEVGVRLLQLAERAGSSPRP